MIGLKKNLRLALSGSIAFGLALSGMPTGYVPTAIQASQAHAAAESVIRIKQSGPGARRTIKLGLNKALVVDLPEDAHDILVADPEMADAVTRTSRRIYLFGKSVGQTNIFIFGPGGEEIVSLDIQIERDIAGLEANLSRFIPESDIKVEIVSDNIVLSGTVRTPQDAARAENLANAFLKGGEATTRNQTATASSNSGDAAVAIFAEERQTSQIVNLLTIEGEDQVTLKVTVAEVSRQVLKQLGFNGRMSDGRSGINFANPPIWAMPSTWRHRQHCRVRRSLRHHLLYQRHGAGGRDAHAGRAQPDRDFRRTGQVLCRWRIPLAAEQEIDVDQEPTSRQGYPHHQHGGLRHRAELPARRPGARPHQPEDRDQRVRADL